MIKKTRNTAAYRRVASRLKRLLGEGQVIEGSLSRVTAGSAAHWHLTRKVNGRTQTLYVPMSSVEEVRGWIRRWKEEAAIRKLRTSRSARSGCGVSTSWPETRRGASLPKFGIFVAGGVYLIFGAIF